MAKLRCWVAITLIALVTVISLGNGAVISKREIISNHDEVSNERSRGSEQLTPQQRRMQAIRDRERKSIRSAESTTMPATRLDENKNQTNEIINSRRVPIRDLENESESVTNTITESLDDIPQTTIPPNDEVPAQGNDDMLPLTFPPFDINRYTPSYSNDESESEAFNDYTTIDYEQQFERLELTTPTPNEPTTLYPEENKRFDFDAEEDSTSVPSIQPMEEGEKNSSSYLNNAEMETKNYDIQTTEIKSTGGDIEETTNEIADTTPTGSSQKRGKYLHDPEEAVIINSDHSGANDLSIPNTAEVWALAGMKSVDHSKTNAGFHYNVTSERDWKRNDTSATKLLTDWMEIMKNSEFSNETVIVDNEEDTVRPTEVNYEIAEEQREVENKVIPVTVEPPAPITTSAPTQEPIISTTESLATPSTTMYPFSSISDNINYSEFSTPNDILVPITTEEDNQYSATEQPVIQETSPMQTEKSTLTVPQDLPGTEQPWVPLTESNFIITDSTHDITTTTTTMTPISITMESMQEANTTLPPVVVATTIASSAEILTTTTTNSPPPTLIPVSDNNFIEGVTESKTVESNNLPEYPMTNSHNNIESSSNNRSNHTQQYINVDESVGNDEKFEATPTTTTKSVVAHGGGDSDDGLLLPMNNNNNNNINGHASAPTPLEGVDDQPLLPDIHVETVPGETTMSSMDPSKILDIISRTSTLTPVIEMDTRVNGHQHVMPTNDTLEVSQIGAAPPAIKEDEPTNGGRDTNAIIAITVSVIAVIALVLLVGFLYVMRKRQKQLTYGQRCRPVGLDAYSLDNVSVFNSVRRKNNLRLSKRSYGNSAFEDPGLKPNNLSIPALAKMATDKLAIYEEFKEIPLVTARVDEVPPGCEDKNRYANVVPLPETRVCLAQLSNDEKTEYINANFVRGPKDNTNYYIACQAPMENTIVDFWRMIWEQNSKVIIMLTDLTENGIEKCAEYLPPSAVMDCNRVFGDYNVTMKNREVKEKYAVSTIHVKNAMTNTWREITHLWYQWPEEGMPTDETSVIAMLLEARSYLKMSMPEQMDESAGHDIILDDENGEKRQKILDLNDDLTEKLDIVEDGGEKKLNGTVANGTIDKSKSLQRTQGPLTVHCSPGTGRTGTIIACDIALRSLEQKTRSVDPPQIVYYVRRGRASSIKTREQYEFIYRCANTYATKLTDISEN